MALRWQHERLVEETVDWFCCNKMPDAGDWEDGYYRLTDVVPDEPRGQAWRVEVDIPTSVKGFDCWLMFVIVEPSTSDRAPYVRDISAVRSGRGEDRFNTYSWREGDGWTLLPDGDERE